MLSLWGKWDGVSQPLPLLGHLLDTAAVALVVWEQCSPPFRQNAIEVLAPGDVGLAQARFAVLAALHDLGKASREFNGQGWSRRRGEFAAHREALVVAGLPMDMPARRPTLPDRERLWLRHEAVTGLVLHDQTDLPSWARRVLMGHHGRYQCSVAGPSQDLSMLRERARDPAWAAVQQSLQGDVVAAVGLSTGRNAALTGWAGELQARLVPFLVALTGLVCVCDWVASDQKFVRIAPRALLEQHDVTGYMTVREDAVRDALAGVLLGSSTPVGDFAALFGGRTPRAGAQSWAAARRHGPGLTIVMAPMGEGKTEVALHLHATDGSVEVGTQAGDGLFFGLPTMATADAVFDRVTTFWSRTSGTGRLAHSRAVLNDFYAPSDVKPTGVCDHGDAGEIGTARDGLRPDDWFSGRHRGLLAPVTVGTSDQVLAAALDHKFVQVRLAALAGKHVVLDEIHTYDAYQQRLLCRLLGWLGAFQCRVTLLSATLPRARVVELAQAWTAGWHAGAAKTTHDQILAEVPQQLPYPAVVTVRDVLVCEPLVAWRQYDLEVRAHVLAADNDGYSAATVALVQLLRAQQPHARIGLIVNTVDRAIALYQALVHGESGETLLLHSRMTAAQRRARTAALHALVGQGAPAGPVLVVATQIAEASLDLDLDVLVTDLAPMASLLQRTGRLWRHSENFGDGWTHHPNLDYRSGDPVVHVLAPAAADGRVAAGFAALPYTTAELRRTWNHPACLDGGNRERLRVPQDLQPAVDAANLTLDDLAEQADLEPDDVQQVLRHLATELAKTTAAHGTGRLVGDRRWRSNLGEDPWGRNDPDWSQLTAPTLWDDSNGVVTRLQELEQAQVLLWDRTGNTPWAWKGIPEMLGKDADRATLLAALDASVPISGRLAVRLRAAAAEYLPRRWHKDAPALLRGLTPLPVSALTGIAVLDPDLGLIRLENP